MEDSTENVVWGFPLHPLSLVTVQKPGFTIQAAPEEARPRERVSGGSFLMQFRSDPEVSWLPGKGKLPGTGKQPVCYS